MTRLALQKACSDFAQSLSPEAAKAIAELLWPIYEEEEKAATRNDQVTKLLEIARRDYAKTLPADVTDLAEARCSDEGYCYLLNAWSKRREALREGRGTVFPLMHLWHECNERAEGTHPPTSEEDPFANE